MSMKAGKKDQLRIKQGQKREQLREQLRERDRERGGHGKQKAELQMKCSR